MNRSVAIKRRGYKASARLDNLRYATRRRSIRGGRRRRLGALNRFPSLFRVERLVDGVQVRARASVNDVGAGGLAGVGHALEFDMDEDLSDGVGAPRDRTHGVIDQTAFQTGDLVDRLVDGVDRAVAGGGLRPILLSLGVGESHQRRGQRRSARRRLNGPQFESFGYLGDAVLHNRYQVFFKYLFLLVGQFGEKLIGLVEFGARQCVAHLFVLLAQ